MPRLSPKIRPRYERPAMTAADAVLGTLSIFALILGGLATWYLLPRSSWHAGWPARLALAHLAGSALMAWTVTMVAVASGLLLVSPVYCVLGFLAFICWKKRQNQHSFQNPVAGTRLPPSTEKGPQFWVGLAAVAVIFGDRTLSIDAYTMWAIKAKAVFIAGSLAPLLSGCCGKVNYPMLFPLQAWWVYRHLGHINDWWDQLMGFLFYMDLLAITFAACRATMNSVWAWMATAIVANNYLHAVIVTKGHADGALSAYFLASSVFLIGYLSRKEDNARAPALLLLLGALQTKNEGFSWVFFATALILLLELQRRTYRRAAFTAALYFLAVAPWTFFKLRNDLPFGTYEPLATRQALTVEWASRVKFIAHTYFAEFGPPSLFFLLLLCMPVIYRGWGRMSKPLLVLIGSQFLSYLMVFFFVSDQLYSMNGFMARGLSHISPALICVTLIGYHSRPHCDMVAS